MTGILIAWLVTSVSLFIISKLPLGIEIDSFAKAVVSAAVFGILNAFLRPILGFFAFPITFLTFGLFSFVLNAIVFGLAALLVHGFRLRGGVLSALIGAIALSIMNSLIYQLLPGLSF